MQPPVDATDAATRLREMFGPEDPYIGRRRLLSPLAINFSQSQIRREFQDGRAVEDAISEISRELLTPLQLEACNGTPSGGNNWWLLQPPFPEIEVIQWRCKLREEDGTQKYDEFGNELYGDREWYTLDNRRLYCLQKVAAALHPAEVRCPVLIIHQEDGNCREFRKFRTPDQGRTIGLGHKDGRDLPRWSWRREAGLAEEVLPVGTAIQRQPRRRAFTGGRRSHQHKDFGRNSGEVRDGSNWDFVMNISLFVLVYASLRLMFYIGRYILTTGMPGASFLQVSTHIQKGLSLAQMCAPVDINK